MAKQSREFSGMRRVDLAYAQVASSEVARDMNRDVVLELIRARQPVSRADLARLSGLQRSTVSEIVEDLIQEEWVREGSVARRPRGRRPTMLGLNEDLVILAVDIHPRQATVAVIDLNGHFLSRDVVAIVSNPERAVENIVGSMRRLQQKHPGKSFEGIGISLPGRVDPKTQRLIFAPNLKWSSFDIRGVVEKAMGLKVEMDNAANAWLLSEMWFGKMDGVRGAVLVTIAEGVGTGLIANGQPIYGINGMAGEFGHIVIDPNGPVCACGARGCWETFASSNAALRFFAARERNKREVGIADLHAMAAEGHANAIAALKEQATYIGRGLRMVAASLSPEVVFIAGDITVAWELVGPVIEAEMKGALLAGKAPRVIPSEEGGLARLRGASALVLQRHSGKRHARGVPPPVPPARAKARKKKESVRG
ncbi:MAG: ROK family transcriptional regulator [Acidobacteriaceae bacterium]